MYYTFVRRRFPDRNHSGSRAERYILVVVRAKECTICPETGKPRGDIEQPQLANITRDATVFTELGSFIYRLKGLVNKSMNCAYGLGT